MSRPFSTARLTVFALIVVMSVPLFAGEPVGRQSGAGPLIHWQLNLSGHDSVTLRAVSPSGDVITREFRSGHAVQLRISDLGTNVEDGQYTYELTVTPKIPGDVAKRLSQARAANDDAAAKKIMKDAGLSPISQTGGFTVSNGGFVDSSLVESDANDATSAPRPGALGTNAARPEAPIAVNDQVIPDDLIVQGSICAGFDCVNNESFGFDTIRLKENNLRIKAEDTSVGTFPTNDWQLTFNDSASGGSSKFSVEDITGAKVPMTITAGASTNSIFVDSTGRVGFRTSTPVLDLHVATSNTPAIRLEQNSSGGFTAQTWDIAGNEANFFVRDVTSGSRLPLRIRPGAPTSALDISADGDVGIGTASPDAQLDIEDSTESVTAVRIRNTQANGNSAIEYLDNAGNIDLFFGIQNSTSTTRMNSLNSNPIVMLVNSTERMRVNTTGVTVTGDFTVSGGTKNFAMPDPANANRAIYYAALEGPEAGTYFRGTAKTVNGEVVIELPGYFARITEPENITVQLTPVGTWGQLYVAEKSHEKLVVRVPEGTTDLAFDYFVQGIRRGYSDFQVERANDLP